MNTYKQSLQTQPKSRTATALFAFLLGWIGVHRFYLGQVTFGFIYLLGSCTGIPAMIAIIDAIIFITMSDESFDAKYNRHVHTTGYNTPPTNRQSPGHQYMANKQQSRRNQILSQVMELRKEIDEKIKSSDSFDSEIIYEIKPMVDDYISKVKELIDKDTQLEKIITAHPLTDIDKEIQNLRAKLFDVTNPELRHEYERTIQRHVTHRESVQEFADQREKISLQIDGAIVSLKQIKFDLIRLESLGRMEQRDEFFKIFEEKSSELSSYLSILKDTYEKSGLS